MSLSLSSRSLFAKCSASTAKIGAASAIRCHQFHASTYRQSRKHKNVSAEKMGLITGQEFPKLTEEELSEMRRKYTPQQMEAIELGEAAIDPEHLATQGRFRVDRYQPRYLDDFATVQPVIDLKGEVPADAKPEPVKWLSHEEWAHEFIDKMADDAGKRVEKSLAGSMARALRKIKHTNGDMLDVTEEELKELEHNPNFLKKVLVVPKEKRIPGEERPPPKEADANTLTQEQAQHLSDQIDDAFFEELEIAYEGESNPLQPSKTELWKQVDESDDRRTSALAANIEFIPGLEAKYAKVATANKEGHAQPDHSARVKRVTGMTVDNLKGLMIKTLVRSMVSNQTRLGKIRSIKVLAIAGNGNGWLGVGIGKSTDPEIAKITAELLAVRNMKPIRRYENRTIYGDVKCKISGTVVELNARPPGFGLRVSHRLFEMCRAVGIYDISGCIPRSRNPFNTVMAAYKALSNQPDPDSIAMGRGMKMVDARKVYYGGNVL